MILGFNLTLKIIITNFKISEDQYKPNSKPFTKNDLIMT